MIEVKEIGDYDENGRKIIEFTHGGFTFRDITGVMSRDYEFVDRDIQLFEEYLKPFVKLDIDGSISVDWEELVRKCNDRFGLLEKQFYVHYSLSHLGILHQFTVDFYGFKELWELWNGITILNPCSMQTIFYFTREKDARAYAKAQYGDTNQRVFLRKVIPCGIIHSPK